MRHRSKTQGHYLAGAPVPEKPATQVCLLLLLTGDSLSSRQLLLHDSQPLGNFWEAGPLLGLECQAVLQQTLQGRKVILVPVKRAADVPQKERKRSQG